MLFRNRQKAIRVADVLHGCTPGRIQSVGYMQVIPLVSELSDDRFVSPVEGEAEVFTTSYGTLGFRNPGDCVLIVPCHAGYVVKQAAQDHAMAHAGVVQSAGERSFNTAMCVQASQGGLIQRGSYRMLILPYALRERALEVRTETRFNKLWDAIAQFNQEMGVQAHGHLDFFLKHFEKELDEFVAEFECVPRQIGAIILVDDQVVGVERARPTRTGAACGRASSGSATVRWRFASPSSRAGVPKRRRPARRCRTASVRWTNWNR